MSPSRQNHVAPPPPPPEQQMIVVNGNGNGNGNGVVLPKQRLSLRPKSNHQPESYEDLQLEFSPLLFSTLEMYLPSQIINNNRDFKYQYMKDLLRGYTDQTQRTRVLKHKEYRKQLTSGYQARHKELFTLSAETFFIPSFLKAINENTAQAIKSIMVEHIPGVFTFDMVQPHFCELLLAEVGNIERWVHETRTLIMRPNTMNKYGIVLDDFGMDTMLSKFMNEFISPMARVLFPEVGGCFLDSHHGFVVEYGVDRDTNLGLHVDDSEVTLNICLGREFSNGEMFFRGVRCDDHMNSETLSEEIYDYTHVPGRAVLHRGRHRHGTRATTTGHRANLLIWCRSSVFRELRKHQNDLSSWCKVCKNLKKEKHRETLETTTEKVLKRMRKTTA